MRHVGAPLTRFFLREHYADLARMEDVLRAATALDRNPPAATAPPARTWPTACSPP
ncbi:hypothetical protein [Kitasatospora sp. CMC57]